MAKGKGLRITNNIALYLLSVGGLNWLLTKILEFDLVDKIFSSIGQGGFATFVYALIGASGVWIGIQALMGNVKVK